MSEAILKPRGWYWKEHGDEYTRFKVGDLPHFCGWNTLLRLINNCDETPYYEDAKPIKGTRIGEMKRLAKKLRDKDKELVANAFETGGRVLEILGLRKEMFTIKSDRVIIRDMPVVKRFKKEREVVSIWEGEGDPPPELNYHFLPKYGGWVKRRYVTRPVLDRRVVLDIPINELLTPYMTAWVERMSGYIFPSYAKNGNPPMTSVRAYQILTDLGNRIGLKICPHWFRSMRASQLASEYGWREFKLMQFFSWKSIDMATKYAKLAPTDLFKSMVVGGEVTNE